MYKKYSINYKGYISLLRITQMYLKDQTLTMTEFAAYLILVMNADFDNRHSTYGQILRTDKEIAVGIGSNQSTIYRHRTSLIRKGLLFQIERYTYVKFLDLYTSSNIGKIAKFDSSKLKNYLAIILRTNAVSYEEFTKQNAGKSHTDSKSNNSSNEESSIYQQVSTNKEDELEDIPF